MESYIEYDKSNLLGKKAKFYDKKLPNALAKTWLYLKKEGYLDA